MRLFCALFWGLLMGCSLCLVSATSSTATEAQGQNAVTIIDVTQRQGNKVTSTLKNKKKHKPTRRERCCHLGRRMAKIGERCRYVTTIASLRPDYQHYHKLKTKVWVTSAQKPSLKVRMLRKCKRFKAFYEKCCNYEASMIDNDLKRMVKRLEKFLRKIKKGRKRYKKDKTTAVKAKGTHPTLNTTRMKQ